MTPLRLLADDLTGALDSAATFGSEAAPVPVRWHGALPTHGSLAVDSGTREFAPTEAEAAVRRLAPPLWADPSILAYKKIDSLLRGNEAREIGAILGAAAFDHSIVAPAFPAQRRITRGGRQLAWSDAAGWQPTRSDLAVLLRASGHEVTLVSPGAPPPPGISLWDAEGDADLDAIAASAPGGARVLWVGSGGLAAALARRLAPAQPEASRPRLARPILGLIGTDHPAMRGQLAAVADRHEAIADAADAARLERLLKRRDAVFASVAVPPGTPRDAAAAMIASVLGEVARRLDPPGTLLCAGGETLRALCDALDARGLDVTGELMPGIPRSVLVGGRWDGTAVISKSGAFGAPGLLRNLIAAETAVLMELEA